MKVVIYQLEKYKIPACNKIKGRLWKPLKIPIILEKQVFFQTLLFPNIINLSIFLLFSV